MIRDRSLGHGFFGRYVYGDFCDGRSAGSRSLRRPRSASVPSGLRVPDLASFGEDGLGRVYAVSLERAGVPHRPPLTA